MPGVENIEQLCECERKVVDRQVRLEVKEAEVQQANNHTVGAVTGESNFARKKIVTQAVCKAGIQIGESTSENGLCSA